jgi:hypothetical protein
VAARIHVEARGVDALVVDQHHVEARRVEAHEDELPGQALERPRRVPAVARVGRGVAQVLRVRVRRARLLARVQQRPRLVPRRVGVRREAVRLLEPPRREGVVLLRERLLALAEGLGRLGAVIVLRVRDGGGEGEGGREPCAGEATPRAPGAGGEVHRPES